MCSAWMAWTTAQRFMSAKSPFVDWRLRPVSTAMRIIAQRCVHSGADSSHSLSLKAVILLFGLHWLAKPARTVALLLEHLTGNKRSGGTRNNRQPCLHMPHPNSARECVNCAARFSEFEFWVLKTPCTCKNTLLNTDH